MSGYDCGAVAEHKRHMADLFSTCHAIGRLEFLIDVSGDSADQRLARVAEIVADLRRDLGMSANPLSANRNATSTDGSTL
ncbi:hypothetical protein GCM10022223_20000 [Kineosporia mesophila]|uniref:Uncharacterized protein n=1 Tax=Kineosporia mesophila TaxID=566012 RepID=A0ABP6ZBL8_9ACTN|nr:hypothetical protein [Kineosporia mesophila]MCD5350099.1 hypothetical protein [Kineosporia mesophila]